MILLGESQASSTLTTAQVRTQVDDGNVAYDASTGDELTAHATLLAAHNAALTAHNTALIAHNTVLTAHNTALTALRGGTATLQETYDEAYETEKHVHNYERWFGKSANQSGNNWATESSLTPFTAGSNAGGFGTAIKVLGPDDTPNQTSMVVFDFHRLLISDLEVTTPYIIRIIEDVDGDGVANTAEGKGYYTDMMVATSDNVAARAGGVPIPVIDKRCVVGARVWVKIKAAGSVDMDFFAGLHEYLR